MKISVITLQNVANYGSVLQTYATQSLLKSMGYDVEFIDYTRKNQTDKEIRKEHINTKSVPAFLKSVYQTYIGGTIINSKKKNSFDKFIHENISVTQKKYYSVEELKADTPEADIYCTGSDQMWNSGWNGGIEHSYFLDFVKNKPKFSFSTSIGMDAIPDSEKEETKALLEKYNFITVREKKAEEILNGLGIKSTTVLDPTLLLDGDFWRSFSSKVKSNNQKYILVYQLNANHNDVDFTNYVKDLSKKTGMPVKVISYGLKIKRVFDEYICLPTIEEFVSLFVNASYVVTDSFHGTSFCINLNKQFTVIYPPKYSSRLSNILQLCGLEARVFTGKEANIYLNTIDYSNVNKIMNQVRKDSLKAIEQGLLEIKQEIN